MRITAKHFKDATGEAPEQDDLERSNCKRAGQFGHSSCGWCVEHNKPMFLDGPCFSRLVKASLDAEIEKELREIELENRNG